MPDDSSENHDELELLRNMSLDDSEVDKVDTLWRQLLVYKSFADNDLSDARARRAQAETAREQAQMEAIRTTQLQCARMRTEVEAELQQASDIKSNAAKLYQEAEAESDRAQEVKAQAEEQRAKIIAEAQRKAQGIIDGAHDIAKRETTELRRTALKEVKSILGRAENMRAAADEELETQRILTNISKIKTTSRWLMGDPDSSESADGLKAWSKDDEQDNSNNRSPSSQSRQTSQSKSKASSKKVSSNKS